MTRLNEFPVDVHFTDDQTMVLARSWKVEDGLFKKYDSGGKLVQLWPLARIKTIEVRGTDG